MRSAPVSHADPTWTRHTGSYGRASRTENRRLAKAKTRQRRRRVTVLALLVAAGVLVGLDLVRGASGEPKTTKVASLPSIAAAAGGVPVQPSPSVEPSPSPPASPAAPVLRMTGDFPSSGPGTWKYAKSQGEILGTAGTLRRFRVAVESNVADEELDEFVSMIDKTLGDPRSWIAGKQTRFQRAASGSSYDFTIYLATGETTRRLCATGGMDTRINGVSYTSCRLWKQVIVNLNRWRLSIDDYVNAQTPLDVYRSYVINHEVGHELGRQHEACPGSGKPAPTMQQQTFGLKGCKANAWPYLDGKRYAGPSIS